jgi:hypothetical protein
MCDLKSEIKKGPYTKLTVHCCKFDHKMSHRPWILSTVQNITVLTKMYIYRT